LSSSSSSPTRSAASASARIPVSSSDTREEDVEIRPFRTRLPRKTNGQMRSRATCSRTLRTCFRCSLLPLAASARQCHPGLRKQVDARKEDQMHPLAIQPVGIYPERHGLPCHNTGLHYMAVVRGVALPDGSLAALRSMRRSGLFCLSFAAASCPSGTA
jgi:hypothetical protein